MSFIADDCKFSRTKVMFLELSGVFLIIVNILTNHAYVDLENERIYHQLASPLSEQQPEH